MLDVATPEQIRAAHHAEPFLLETLIEEPDPRE
jgi:hypothetical protein